MFMFLFLVTFVSLLFFEQFAVKAITEVQMKLPWLRNKKSFEEIHADSYAINLVFGVILTVFASGIGGGAGSGSAGAAVVAVAVAWASSAGASSSPGGGPPNRPASWSTSRTSSTSAASIST